MDALLNPNTADYAGEFTHSLANAVYLRLRTPLGAWWADTSLGSRLHELVREKDVVRVYMLARQYAEQALQTLLDDGRAQTIVVTASQLRAGWCDLHIQVKDMSGQVQHFEHPVRVV